MFEWVSGFGMPGEWMVGIILDTALKGTALLLVLGIILRFVLRSATASIRYTTCVLAAGGLLLLPFVSALVPQWRIPLPEGAVGILKADCGKTQNAPAVVSKEDDQRELGRTMEGGPSFPSPVSRLDDSMFLTAGMDGRTEVGENSAFSLVRVSGRLQTLEDGFLAVSGVGVGLWTGGVFLTFLPWLVGLVALYRLLRNSRRVEEGPWSRILEETCRSMAMPLPRLYQTDLPLAPMAGGFLRAFIIVPSDARLWSKDKMRNVLIHELGHLRRHDDLTYLPVRLVASLHWFNPLAWALLRKLRFERERACDDFVLNQGIASCDYASHLLEIMKETISIHPAMSAASPMATPRRLEERVLAILDDKMNRKDLTMRHFMIVTIVTSLVTVFIGTATVVGTAASSEGTPRVQKNVPANINPDPATLTGNVQDLESELTGKNLKPWSSQEGSPAAGSSDSRISLFEAARTAQAGAIEQAVKEGASINTSDENGKTALHFAAENGHGETACALIKLGADPSIRDREGRTAQDLALQKGHTGTAAMIQLVTGNSPAPFFEAARMGQWDVVEKMVRVGAPLNAQDDEGKTALHHAAENGHGETACTLIKLGVDPSIRDREGRTAQDLALQKGHTGTAAMVKSASANSRISLFEAARTGQAGAIEQAVKEGVSINTCDGNGKTALHYAAENGHGETACAIIKLGADPSIRDREGQTALDLALQKGHTGTAAMVKSATATNKGSSLPVSKALAVREKWGLWRDVNHNERPPVKDGIVTLSIGETDNLFPQYLNELGTDKIRLRFAAEGRSQKRFSFVFSGGSLGPDCFQAQLDGHPVSQSPVIQTAGDPYTYYRHQFVAKLGEGNEHVLEISSPEKYRDSAIEFSSIQMDNPSPVRALPLEKLWSDAGR